MNEEVDYLNINIWLHQAQSAGGHWSIKFQAGKILAIR